jgi:hypothetical protein
MGLQNKFLLENSKFNIRLQVLLNVMVRDELLPSEAQAAQLPNSYTAGSAAVRAE